MNTIAPFDAAWTLIPILFFVGSLVMALLVLLLFCWILYTIVWRGVRRGLQEFHGTRPHGESPREFVGFARWSPPEEPVDPPARDRRHRSGRLTR